MDIYNSLRAFADSWMLLFMFIIFLWVIVWVFRPDAKSTYQDTSKIPFRHDKKPLENMRKVKTQTSNTTSEEFHS